MVIYIHVTDVSFSWTLIVTTRLTPREHTKHADEHVCKLNLKHILISTSQRLLLLLTSSTRITGRGNS